jgi:hypothetical protein
MSDTYKMNRASLVEAVRGWKGSGFYKPVNERFDSSDLGVTAPWIPEPTEGLSEGEVYIPFATQWVTEQAAVASFMDVAEQFDASDLSDFIESICGVDGTSTKLFESIRAQLDSNEGKVMLLGREDGSAYAVQCQEGIYFASEVELDEEIIDEGLISMQLVASGGQAGDAPIVPGFPWVALQDSLYEVLHTTNMLISSLDESEEKISEGLSESIAAFCSDLANIIAEVSLDESASEQELNLIVDLFRGTYAGLFEAVTKDIKAK